MSILRALNTGATGLQSHGEALGVVGDNIANVNTVGYKRSRADFEDVLGRSIAGSAAVPQAGAGSRLAHIEQMWTQGALLTTESPTDLALTGDGTFVVSGTVGGMTGNFYTRAGQFHVDASGRLVNPNGLRLQGYGVNEDGMVNGTIGDLVVDAGTIPASATTQVDLAANLDANAAVPALPWDPADPGGTSNFSTAVTTYDSLGNAHQITVYFRKTADNAWDWHAMADGAEIQGGTPGVPTEGASGSLTFTTDGALDTETVAASSWNFVGATGGQAIAFDFGTSVTTDGGTGIDATTQFGSASTTTGISQDGFAAGTVAGIAVDSDGTVSGVFTNGQRRTLGQVVVADFANVGGLARAGDGLWVETKDSGAALVGAAESGSRGSIVAGALEQANVDLGREFVDLIAYQRGFQASSRIIQAADEMYGELVNLRR
jgi:flagellar hook protein FlgE